MQLKSHLSKDPLASEQNSVFAEDSIMGKRHRISDIKDSKVKEAYKDQFLWECCFK